MMRGGTLLWNCVGVLASTVLFIVVVVMALTMWGIGKSRERTECYKTATAVADCSQPGMVERALRTILGPKSNN